MKSRNGHFEDLPISDFERPRDYWAGAFGALSGRPKKAFAHFGRETLRSIVQYIRDRRMVAPIEPQNEWEWRQYRGMDDGAIAFLRKFGWVCSGKFPGLDRRCSRLLVVAGFQTPQDVLGAVTRGDFASDTHIRKGGELHKIHGYGVGSCQNIVTWVSHIQSEQEPH